MVAREIANPRECARAHMLTVAWRICNLHVARQTSRVHLYPAAVAVAAGLSDYLDRVSGCVVVTDDVQYRVSYLVQRH